MEFCGSCKKFTCMTVFVVFFFNSFDIGPGSIKRPARITDHSEGFVFKKTPWVINQWFTVVLYIFVKNVIYSEVATYKLKAFSFTRKKDDKDTAFPLRSTPGIYLILKFQGETFIGGRRLKVNSSLFHSLHICSTCIFIWLRLDYGQLLIAATFWGRCLFDNDVYSFLLFKPYLVVRSLLKLDIINMCSKLIFFTMNWRTKSMNKLET